jgi:hypothetical protein
MLQAHRCRFEWDVHGVCFGTLQGKDVLKYGVYFRHSRKHMCFQFPCALGYMVASD